MKKKLQLLMIAMLASSFAYAQTEKKDSVDVETEMQDDGQAFTFNESQLGEDDDMTKDVIQVGSASNVYTSQYGYAWSAVRFRFRALDNRYNDVYLNGVMVNNAENGRFVFSNIGGMNDATRQKDQSSPFESNSFGVAGIGGATNYDFRAGNQASGHKMTLTGTNRNYSLRGMYTYGTGMTESGWAFFGTVGYRWTNMELANVNGTFYNSLSYFMAVQKQWENHSLSLTTWGNPTERATAGPSTDEAYWLANDNMYNPFWGYQNGQKRASRIVTDYAPSGLLTWDWKIKDNMKLTTSAFFKYQMYGSTKLNYSGTNPAPDYWKNFPSYNYDVWGTTDGSNNNLEAYWNSVDYWTASDYNRQIQFDNLYFANTQLNKSKSDAIYWIQKRHNDHMAVNLSSNFNYDIDKDSKFLLGFQLASNQGKHYQTMDDLLGGEYFHNINTYAISNYGINDPRVQYDLNHYDPANPYSEANRIRKGDRFGYDYDLMVQKFALYTQITRDMGISHNFIGARIGGSRMWRNGHMRNGLFNRYENDSYGKSGVAGFLDGGLKLGSTLNLGKGHSITFGAGIETKSPNAEDAFVNPEMCNDFVTNLKNEKIASGELSYNINNSWLRLSLTGYFNASYEGTDWTCYFDDNEASFMYVSSTNMNKRYYGVELGAKFKVTSSFDITLLGTYSEAEFMDNCDVVYMLSNEGTMSTQLYGGPTKCFTKGIHEGGTPLTAVSLGLNYRINGWFLNLTGNYYDRIYMSYTPVTRLQTTQELWAKNNYGGAYIDNEGVAHYSIPEQARGNGGFMLDASIGKSFRIGKNPLNVNLQLCNLTNNRKITTGGYEQSRMAYSNNNGTFTDRTYNPQKFPKKFYAQGFNFMMNVNYRF